MESCFIELTENYFLKNEYLKAMPRHQYADATEDLDKETRPLLRGVTVRPKRFALSLYGELY